MTWLGLEKFRYDFLVVGTLVSARLNNLKVPIRKHMQFKMVPNGILGDLLPHQAPAVHKKRHYTTLKVKTTIVTIEMNATGREVFLVRTSKHTFYFELCQ